MRESGEKTIWGKTEKIGKGTKANYDPEKKIITFCFNRNPQTSSENLRKSRETLMKELRELGYESRMKYNGEVLVEKIEEEDVVLVKKDHKLIIRLNKKNAQEKKENPSESN